MSERPTSNIIERVRKILAKTEESGCPQAEAETAFAMANRLLTEHNLSMDDIRLSGLETEEQFMEEGVFATGRWEYTHNLAYNIVREYFFVQGFFGERDGNQKVLYLFGTTANVATARFTFHALLNAASRLWSTYKILNRRPASEGRTFKVGVMSGFKDKLNEERAAQKMERDILSGSTGGTELALRRVEDQTVQKYKEAHPQHNKAKSASYASLRGSQSTLQAGYNAGKSLNLNRAVDGGKQKGIVR